MTSMPLFAPMLPRRAVQPTRSPRRGVVGRIVAGLRAAVRAAEARRQFETLDDATLRDLGVSRSEQGSYHAESQCDVETTRLRVAPLNDRWIGL